MSEHRPLVAIVGGGLSGLVAAFATRRQLPDARVVLLEQSDRVGGVIRTERHDRFLLELGADSFSVSPPGVEDICQQLGIADRLVAPRDEYRRALILHRDRLLPVPEGFALLRPADLRGVLTSPLLSWAGRARLLSEWWVPSKKDNQDESLQQFAVRRFGQQAFDRLIQPLVAGIYTADAARLSMQATMPQFVRWEREHGSMVGATLAIRKGDNDDVARSASGARYQQFRSFPGGMQELFDALVRHIDPANIRLGADVRSLHHDSATGQMQIRLGSSETLDCDAVVLALPAPALSPLLHGVDPQASALVATVPYASSALVVLAVPRSQVAHPLDAFGLVVPKIAGRKIIAASFLNRKFEHRCPEDHHLIRVFIGGALQEDLLELDDQGLIELACSELADIIGMRAPPTLARVGRWNQAMPQYHVGHCQRREQFQSIINRYPGLEIAGNAFDGVGIAHCVRTAQAAAERVVAHVKKRS